MDTSQQYITMCKEAHEIQALKEYPKTDDWQKLDELDEYFIGFDEGDFIAFNSNSFDGVNIWVFSDPIRKKEVQTIKCWLPRQDQLSDMIKSWNKKISSSFFLNISSNSKYRGIPIEGYDSLEKHLLCFVMKEEYKKTWDSETQKWI